MFKRFFDVVVSLLFLILLSPVFLVIALILKLKIGSPVLFFQMRPGLNGKPFQMIKFRTMHDFKDERGEFLSDSLRMTRIGSFLRTTSLDELPEFWNVLKGDMSLVGPRPLLMEYLPFYTVSQMERHQVKPGITGWAQVNGRNALIWEDKFKFDLWYVKHQSFLLDLKILVLTLKQVISRKGINTVGHVSSEKFQGNDL